MFKENALIKVFAMSLNKQESEIHQDFRYGADWSSVGHMALVAAIEAEFGIMLDTSDVIDMSSYAKAKEILRKYDIEFES